ncbi:MAG: sigma factor-like helix-turn-helix DNA-binding protein, partial [Pyrinomonadaceae bacterium]
ALQQGRARKTKTPECRVIGERDSVVKPEDLAGASSEVPFRSEELRIDLENAIQRANLTPSELEVLKLDLQDLTNKEIADHLCKPLGTVKPLLFKAKKKLKLAIANP